MTSEMHEDEEVIREGLASRFVLEALIGRGGMGAVYRARDVRHERTVALKVLRSDWSDVLGARRFQLEITTVARLQHPHILPVFDSGDVAGRMWFTMPFVDGESLRDRLQREGRLAANDAVRITTEIARALDYAHRQGVVHRDIKPENILLTKNGDAMVADFGIARASTGDGERLTQTGIAIGTPAYMSPEQATGDPHLDARTDVYALGSVLFEMLAGEPPFTGPTPQAVIAKRFSGVVPSVRTLRRDVEPNVEHAITRALALNASERFTTIAEFAHALGDSTSHESAGKPLISRIASGFTQLPRRVDRLKSTVLALVVIAALAVAGFFAWQRSQATTAQAPIGPPRLAVLPFENQGDSLDAYFADGITDAVRGKLSELPGIRVIARSSSTPYRGTSKTPQQIGKELGVSYLLTATVRWQKSVGGATSRVQVSPELIDVRDSTTTWGQPFDAALTDVFQVQADIAGRVARALNVALGDSTQRRMAIPLTANLAAYDAFLRGEQSAGISDDNPVSLRRAAVYYEQATELDPQFGLAWAKLGLARSHLFGIGQGLPSDSTAARLATERAIAVAPDRPEAHNALGTYYRLVMGDFARARSAFETGLRLAPGDASLMSALAVPEMIEGRWSEALSHVQRASDLDPRSIEAARRLGFTLRFLRRYPESQQSLDRALAMEPGNLHTINERVMLDLSRGSIADAQAVLNATPREVDRVALVVYVALLQDLAWMLDDVQQSLLLKQSATPFDNDRVTWGLALAQTHWLRADRRRAQAYADSARIAIEQKLPTARNDAFVAAQYGLALAYLGRKRDAIREGQRATTLIPLAKNGFSGPYVQHQLVRILLLVNEPGMALDWLEPLLKAPYDLSPGWLRIDPTFAPLRGNPRFELLVR